MRTQIVSVFLILLAAATLPAFAGDDGGVSALSKIVDEKTLIAAQWERSANVQLVVAIAGIILGCLISALQASKAKEWEQRVKIVVIVLGATSAAITYFISHAPVSSSSYQKAALQARAKISALHDDLNFLVSTQDAESQKGLKDEFTKTVKEIDQIELKLSGEDRTLTSLWDPTPVVYAGAIQPAWVTSLPSSPTDLYFRGEAESSSLPEARSKSLESAIESCVSYLMSQGKSVPIEAARAYAKTSTTTADTYLAPGGKGKSSFRYYTLLRMDRSLARPEVIATLSGVAQQPPPPKQMQSRGIPPVGSDCSTHRINDYELAAFAIGDRKIYIYLNGQKAGTPDRADFVVIPESSPLMQLVKATIQETHAGAPVPESTKVSRDIVRSVVQDNSQMYPSLKLENGSSSQAIVDGEPYRIQAETHFVKRYANVTACRAR